MGSEVDKIYSNDQNAFSVSTNQSIYSNELTVGFDPLSVDESIDQTLYGGKNSKKLASKKIKKNTKTISTIAATMVASSLGIVGVINPLMNRPKVTKGKYEVVENKLNYSFSFSSTNNYHSSLLLYLNDEKIEELPFENQKTIEGSFTLKDHGDYHLDIYSTNNVDYQKQTVLYKFTY